MAHMRRLVRSALLAVTLAYALALSGLIGARVMAAHAGEAHAFAALKAICSAHGLPLPEGGPSEHSHNHPDCSCGPACAFKTFAAGGRNKLTVSWSPAEPDTVVYAATAVLPVGSRAPPDLTARGPPILI